MSLGGHVLVSLLGIIHKRVCRNPSLSLGRRRRKLTWRTRWNISPNLSDYIVHVWKEAAEKVCDPGNVSGWQLHRSNPRGPISCFLFSAGWEVRLQPASCRVQRCWTEVCLGSIKGISWCCFHNVKMSSSPDKTTAISINLLSSSHFFSQCCLLNFFLLLWQ